MRPLMEAGEVEFENGNATAPKQLCVTDQYDKKYIFRFVSKGNKMLWLPIDKNDNRFLELRLMRGDSFHLLDKYDNTTVFYENGKFKSILPSAKSDLVSQIICGTQHIVFVYSFNKTGKLYVKEAKVYLEKVKKNPDYIVKYSYTKDIQLTGRKVYLPGGKEVAWR